MVQASLGAVGGSEQFVRSGEAEIETGAGNDYYRLPFSEVLEMAIQALRMIRDSDKKPANNDIHYRRCHLVAGMFRNRQGVSKRFET
jgi:hypothetical protein